LLRRIKSRLNFFEALCLAWPSGLQRSRGWPWRQPADTCRRLAGVTISYGDFIWRPIAFL